MSEKGGRGGCLQREARKADGGMVQQDDETEWPNDDDDVLVLKVALPSNLKLDWCHSFASSRRSADVKLTTFFGTDRKLIRGSSHFL